MVPVETGLSAVVHLWQHGSTLQPLTFNVIVAGTDEEPARHRLELWLASHALRLRNRLDRLDGRVELQVHIGLDPEEVDRNDRRAGTARADRRSDPLLWPVAPILLRGRRPTGATRRQPTTTA